jgi:uncharacterized lipoprotein YehR (DUF1307 family)
MKKTILFVLAMMTFSLMVACGDTDVVETGTYQGTIDTIKPEEEEIYVSLDNGKRIELYFTKETQVMQDTTELEFNALSKNQRVQVEVEKVGKRLDPIMVKILD